MCPPGDSFTVELLHMCLQNLKHAASHGNIFCASWRPCKRRGISTSSTVTHKCASPSFTDLRPCQMRLGNLFAVAKRISKTFFSSLQMTDMESRPIAASTFFFTSITLFHQILTTAASKAADTRQARQILVGILLRSDVLVM